MTAVRPAPAYWRWVTYADVRPAHSDSDTAQGDGEDSKGDTANEQGVDANKESHSQPVRRRQPRDASATASRQQSPSSAASAAASGPSYTLHVRESLVTPLSLTPRDSASELAALPALVLVHGMVVSGSYLTAVGACLAPYFRVYVPDLPGYGRSVDAVLGADEALEVGEQAEVLAAWMEQAGLISRTPPREPQGGQRAPPPPFLLGNSLGCSLIVELARRYPHAVRGAVLQGPVQDQSEAGAIMQLLQFALNGRNEPIAQGIQVLKDYRTAGWRRVYATWKTMRKFDTLPALQHTRAPMLLLCGELDTVSPPHWCLRLVRARQQGGLSLAVMLDTPHTAVATAPEAAAEIVRLYFAKVIEKELQKRQPDGQRDGNAEADDDVQPPRVTTDFTLSLSNARSFVMEAVPLVLAPALLLLGLLAACSSGDASFSLFGMVYVSLLVVAVGWRLRHRRHIVSLAQGSDAALWPSSITSPPVPGVADFDSATGFLRAHSLALRGHDVPFLGRPPFAGDRFVSWLLNSLPDKVRILAYAIIGAAEATPAPIMAATLDTTKVLKAVVAHYPLDVKYPAVAMGSSSGALLHLYHALAIPWLPNTLMFGIARPDPARKRARFPGLSHSQDKSVIDLSAELEWGDKYGKQVLENNPLWQLHHMADPCQDSLMVAWMSYFRLKQRVLPPEYKSFLLRHLQPGGAILLAHNRLKWATVRVRDGHYFQMGAYGGLQAEDYLRPNAQVDDFLRREVLKQSEVEIKRAQQAGEVLHWNAPVRSGSEAHWAPEAEWGLPDSFRDDVEAFAREHGFRVVVLEHDDPQDPAPLVADLMRDWNQGGRRDALIKGITSGDDTTGSGTAAPNKQGVQVLNLSVPLSSSTRARLLASSPPSIPSRLSLRDQHLFISQFVLVEPWWAARTGSVPFWTVFSTRHCWGAAKEYMEANAGVTVEGPEAGDDKEGGKDRSQLRGDAAADATAASSISLLTRYRSASAALFPHGIRSINLADAPAWLSLLRHPDLLLHPQQSASRDSEPSLPTGGTALVGVREELFPADFQTMLHFHQQAHLLTQQRYAMPVTQQQHMQLHYAMERWGQWTKPRAEEHQ